MREAIEARRANLMLLPPYSHDFNPIEQVFAKLKALLRKSAPLECLNYRQYCGYGHPRETALEHHPGVGQRS